MIDCCIFDLDGVVVDTARYHYLAWAALARELGFEFTPVQGEATKGVSRMASLEIVLRAGGLEGRFSAAERERLAAEKNARYLRFVSQMTPAEVLPGVAAFLHDVRSRGVRTVLGSASKNAGTILDRCGLRPLFDAVVDGNEVSRAKPDPEVFLGKGLLYFVVSYWGHVFGVRVEADLRRDLYSHMESLSFSFFDKNRTA